MTQDNDLQRRIVTHVNRPNYRPVKPAVIARQLDLPKDQHRDLKRAIKDLVKKGRLRYGSNHLVRPAAGDAPSRITGVFHRTDKGYGFVRPSDTPLAAGRTADIYIPVRKTQDAATGDTVLVRLVKRRGRPGMTEDRLAGEIVEILERETHQFVGTYFEAAGTGCVEIDGGVFARAILVGDPGAKNAKPDDKVVVEMVRFPSHAHDGEGVITEVLGPRGQPGVDTLSIVREFNLRDDFSEDVLEAARVQADKFDESIGRDRRDLTGQTVITIDPFDARDFDDAISLDRLDNGHWVLGVHIADVSHFVRPRGALDREARERATSVYLPDRVLPMLPEVISNNLASLQPGRVRYTKTVLIEFTAEGVHVHTDACSAAIKSKRRFDYEQVDDFLAHPKRWQKKLKPEVFALLGRMHELAMILRRRRMDGGAIELSSQEIKLELDKNGRVSGAHVREHTESHQIIEEFMLAANEAVAVLLRDKELDFLRRIHESPDPRKLRALTDFVRELGIECESLESRFEIKRVLKHVEGLPEERAVNYAVLRSLQKAVYSPADEGHYALASDSYCHFTSPIRRYPDLTVHRLLDGIFKRRKPTARFDDLLVLGRHCSDREQRAESAERELTKVKLLTYLSERIGHKMDAVITGVERFGLFAQGVELPAEGLIHVNTLTDDHYTFDKAAHSLAGRKKGNSYRLGDPVRVEVARVDVDRRELDFRLVGRLAHPARKTAPKKAAKKKKPAKKKTRKKSTRRRR